MHRVELSLTSFKLRLSIYFLSFDGVVSIKVSLHQPTLRVTSFRKENKSRYFGFGIFFLYFFRVFNLFNFHRNSMPITLEYFARESFVYLIFA